MQDIQEPDIVKEELMPYDNQVALPIKQAAAPSAATPQQMRVLEVATALEPAYAKASTLELSDAEIQSLMAPFPDPLVEIRPHDGLIYIPHIHVSNRLNQIFKPGKWALVCRRHWLEGRTMYGEYVLLVRGCFIGESIGGHPYQPNNPKTNYSDTLESTAAEALRRICGKRLSCGSQVWEPEYARQWVAQHAFKDASGYWQRRTIKHPKPAAPKPEESYDACTEENAGRAQADTETEAEAAMGKALQAHAAGNSDTGMVNIINSRSGTKKNGQPWTRYGVKIGENWYNTFDRKMGEDAEALKDSLAAFQWKMSPDGKSKDLISIEAAKPF